MRWRKANQPLPSSADYCHHAPDLATRGQPSYMCCYTPPTHPHPFLCGGRRYRVSTLRHRRSLLVRNLCMNEYTYGCGIQKCGKVFIFVSMKSVSRFTRINHCMYYSHGYVCVAEAATTTRSDVEGHSPLPG